jgi:phosphoribosylamine--glycine ligase
MGEKILIIGSGGREHALGWSIAQDSNVEEVIYAKGNPGTSYDKKCANIELDAAKKDNFARLADIVEKENINAIVVGPEQPLVDGIVDFFNGKGYKNIFGPTSAASMIESDKFFSYDLMRDAGIPQARSINITKTGDAERLLSMVNFNKGIVIKARGLTAGKGVYVCDSAKEARKKLKEHAAAYGPEVIIAERLFGQEFSVFGISDGERVVPLEMSVQDHKPLLDGDKGPNTGGMGAYGPVPIADAAVVRKVAEKMMTPAVQQMKKNGVEYKGFLYAAVIMTDKGPKILEYNCRFGDPEAQPSVMMLKNGLYQPIKSALEGKLDEIKVEFRPGASCCVVMASDGYPGSYEKGLKIGGLEKVAKLQDVKVFHAGTGFREGAIITAGGRVLGITAYSSEGIEKAQEKAYEAVKIIDEATTQLNGKKVLIYRNDIASKALK